MDERKQIEEMANSIASTPIGTVKPDLTLDENPKQNSKEADE